MDGENLGQGRENTRQYLRDNPDVTAQLREKIMSLRDIQWGNGAVKSAEGDEGPDDT
jgi:recombination protein RecA